MLASDGAGGTLVTFTSGTLLGGAGGGFLGGGTDLANLGAVLSSVLGTLTSRLGGIIGAQISALLHEVDGLSDVDASLVSGGGRTEATDTMPGGNVGTSPLLPHVTAEAAAVSRFAGSYGSARNGLSSLLAHAAAYASTSSGGLA